MLARSPLWADPRRQPPCGSVRINYAHPLARDLLALWLFNEGSGLPYNLVTGATGSSTSAPIWTTGPAGIGLEGNHDVRIRCPLRGPSSAAAATMAAGFVASATASYYSLFTAAPGDGSVQGLHLSGTAGNPMAFTWDATSGEYNAATGLTVPLGSVCATAAALTAVGNGSPYQQILRSPTGILTYQGTQQMFARSLMSDWYLGAYSGAFGSREWHGTVYWAGLWTRTFSSDHLGWVTDEPYALLEPIIRRRYFHGVTAAQFRSITIAGAA